MKKIVEHYAIGKVITSFEPKALAAEITTVLKNQEQLEQWRKNCIFASEQEQWDKEVTRLVEFYPTVN